MTTTETRPTLRDLTDSDLRAEYKLAKSMGTAAFVLEQLAAIEAEAQRRGLSL